jgi:TM2 domain-containing membrane protein YozV
MKKLIYKGMLVMQNKKFWAYFFALIPGAGHMYLGLQKKGIQLMVSFFLLITLCSWVDIPLFAIFIPVIWFYSIFDVRRILQLGITQDDTINFNIPLNINGNKTFAYILIFIGCIALLKNVILPIANVYISWEVIHYFKTIIVSLMFIGIGIKLLMGNKRLLLPSKKEALK